MKITELKALLNADHVDGDNGEIYFVDTFGYEIDFQYYKVLDQDVYIKLAIEKNHK